MFNFKAYLLNLLMPFLSRKYKFKLAKTQEEKEKIFKFRHQIYRIELSHHFLDEKLAVDEKLQDKDDKSENSFILSASDKNGNIIGTIRMMTWKREELPDAIKEKYFLTNQMLNPYQYFGEFRFFQVSPKYRKSLLGVALACHFYKLPELKFRLPEMILLDCQPGLVNKYLLLGCFTYCHKVITDEFGILQIPMVLLPCDLNHLKKINCITYNAAKNYLNQFRKKFPLSTHSNFYAPSDNIPHLSIYKNSNELKQYVNTIQNKKIRDRYNFLIDLLKNYYVIEIDANKSIIKKDIVDYDMFLIAEGSLGVYINNILITHLNAGSIIGEMAFLHSEHMRVADIITLTPVKIIVIPRNIKKVLLKKNPKLAIDLLNILIDSLSEKLAYTNSLLLKYLENKDKK